MMQNPTVYMLSCAFLGVLFQYAGMALNNVSIWAGLVMTSIATWLFLCAGFAYAFVTRKAS